MVVPIMRMVRSEIATHRTSNCSRQFACAMVFGMTRDLGVHLEELTSSKSSFGCHTDKFGTTTSASTRPVNRQDLDRAHPVYEGRTGAVGRSCKEKRPDPIRVDSSRVLAAPKN